MDLLERLIDKYIERIKTSFPEDDKLMIDLKDFANELSINRASDETQADRQNEQTKEVCECSKTHGVDIDDDLDPYCRWCHETV